MASDYTITMKDLLTGIKDLYKDYGDGTKDTSLSDVRTYKRGILGVNTVYPAITAFPIREVIVQRRSGHVQVVERTVNTEIYIKGYSSESSERSLLDYEEKIRNVYYDSSNPNNYQIPNADTNAGVWNFEIERYQFSNDDQDVIQGLVIPIKYYSLEDAQGYTISAQIEEETKDIGDQFRTVFKADSDLSNVMFFYNNTIPPVPITSGSALCIKERFSDDSHRELGRDTEKREFHIYTWTKLSPYEGSLDLHLDTVEAVKNTLHENTMWGGRSYCSYIVRIEHGINAQKLMYGSEFTYVTNTYRVLPSY
ncbi:MAG: hypothetical protein ACFE95_02735 [Candidatus Hodarchaeota archaeon]